MKRRILSFALALALLVSLCACSKQDAESGALKIYVSKDDYAMSTAAEAYKAAHSELSVDIVSFETYDALETRLASELPAGGGPDVILVNRYMSGIDLRKLAVNGRLLPLGELFDKDESFDREKYYAPVLDAGMIGGVQYTVPIAFSMPAFMATQDKMAEIGFAEKERISMDELFAVLAEEAEKTKGEKTKAPVCYWTFSLSTFLMASNAVKLDFAEKTVEADREALHAFLDGFRFIYEAGKKRDAIMSNLRTGEELADWVAFFGEEFDPVIQFGNYLTVYYNKGGHRTQSFAVTGYGSDGYTARVMYEAAINRNTKNADAAFAFIREVMDGPAPQLAPDGYYKGLGRPFSVNSARTTLYLTQTALETFKGLYLQDLYPCIEAMLEGLTRCDAWSGYVNVILSDTLTPYLAGEQDFEACCESMLSSLTLYMTE